ncbi:hypothetical protein Rhe02_07120 [Rhizocola hellebori]|uniref:LysR substrate-binding domain-containing protein n=1 Tax=Rhizocola hellebori TaxID=1392758 RepID=A0A8J3Q3N1_9ACTN|nr:LysR family substrate-binding domain-containing protein [Rhizocola hellebori]GIH02645.1 hypothetical protein Rhe02_07120 [Rhizocola hellebori]
MPLTFGLLVVPGVTTDKWSRLWAERQRAQLRLVPSEAAEAAELLLSGQVDAGLVRLPVDQEAFHAIPLYTETTVVVVPRDHLISAAEEVTLADLADQTLVIPADDVLAWTELPAAVLDHHPSTTAAAVELVAASVGVLVVPQSLARLYHRRDLTYRPLTGAPTSSVALAWPRDGHTELVEEMIGIVRGRTANSTRGQAGGGAAREKPTREKPAPKGKPRRGR